MGGWSIIDESSGGNVGYTNFSPARSRDDDRSRVQRTKFVFLGAQIDSMIKWLRQVNRTCPQSEICWAKGYVLQTTLQKSVRYVLLFSFFTTIIYYLFIIKEFISFLTLCRSIMFLIVFHKKIIIFWIWVGRHTNFLAFPVLYWKHVSCPGDMIYLKIDSEYSWF